MKFKIEFLFIFLTVSSQYCSDVLTFDQLFPTTTYEKSYKVTAKLYYSIQDFVQSNEKNNLESQFLNYAWNSALKLHIYVDKLISSGEYATHINDYIYLRDLISEVKNKFKELNLADDFAISTELLFNTILNFINRSLENLSKNCN